MIENNIPTSKHIVIDNADQFTSHNLVYPVIVKPVDSNSSKGVRRADTPEELEGYLKDALTISRDGRAIIEEFNEGREIGLDCIIQNGEVVIVMSRERRKMILNKENPIQQIQGSFWPADLTDSNLVRFKNIAREIAVAFDLKHTTLMIQSIVNGDEINVIEFAARIGGGENYKIIKLLTGYDIIESGLNSFTNRPMQNTYDTPNGYIADIYIYAKKSIFGSIQGLDSLFDDKTIEYSHVYKSKGMEIGKDLSSNNRIGAFIVKSKTTDGLIKRINKALDTIEVFDISGLPIMIKDIYSRN